jgi:hypothetical protein
VFIPYNLEPFVVRMLEAVNVLKTSPDWFQLQQQNVSILGLQVSFPTNLHKSWNVF